MLRSNIKSDDPGHLWRLYLQLVEVEQAFKELKNDLSIRPIYHQLETRIEAHIFIAFLAYCLLVTLKQRLKTLAPGLTARAVLEKLATMQMIDVELPTTDDRLVVLSRYTEPEKDQLLLLRQWLLWRYLLIWPESDRPEYQSSWRGLLAQRLQGSTPAEIVGEIFSGDAMEATHPFL